MVSSFLIKGAVKKNGYLGATFYKNCVRKSISVHRIIAEAFILNHLNLPQVNHINGIKSDNRVENLEWSTCKENTKHAWKNGLCTLPIGELNNRAKLTESQVLEIRSLNGTQSQLSIAKLFGISQGSVTNIINRKSWTYI